MGHANGCHSAPVKGTKCTLLWDKNKYIRNKALRKGRPCTKKRRLQKGLIPYYNIAPLLQYSTP